MSSEPRESNPDVDQDEHTDAEHSAGPPALTLALPDGCESVSDAIVTNREMLREPQQHGLATDEDITHLSEAMEGLSTKVEKVGHKHEESRSDVEELQETVEQQRQQIEDQQQQLEEQGDQIDHLQQQLENKQHQIDEQRQQIDDQLHQIDQQHQQIDELQSMVTQLMDILGTDAEWETFDDA